MGDDRLSLSIGGVAEAGPDILFRQVGEVGEDFLVGHSGSQIGQHIIDGDSQATDTGPATALSWFDSD